MKPIAETLIAPDDASDAGGVAGRRGFRYQDHVAAGFVIEMLNSSELYQVEFETADDIVLRWNRNGAHIYEYVQVKTTEDDSKWSISELLSRDNNRPGTSLAEKALACDKHGGTALFRLVTKRDARNQLKPFCVERNKRRTVQPLIDKLTNSIGNKYKTAVSISGRTLRDWAASLFWQVQSDLGALTSANINSLIREAGGAGEPPSHAEAVKAYNELVLLAADAADASKQAAPDAKAISRQTALIWWNNQLKIFSDSSKSSLKVYRVTSERFFADLHRMDETHIRRSMQSYDAEFDDSIWRAADLIDHLLDWLPEISLPAKVLAEYNHLRSRALTRKSIRELGSRRHIDDSQLIAELLLHAVLRHYFDSEPIGCKIFYGTGAERTSTSAHIVQHHTGDQLWIGRARLTTASTHAAVVEAVLHEMATALTKDLLCEERNLIVQLREPQHMRSTTLESALQPRAKLQDLLKCLQLPILIAYDSDVIASGFSDTYAAHLRDEAIASYQDLKSRLPPSLGSVHVHIFLIPVENAEELVKAFSTQLRRP